MSTWIRNKVPVKIKRLHPDAVIPRYATEGAAGFDLVAVEDIIITPGETKKVPLGLAFEIPEGYVMYVCMRSGIALKTKLRQPNGIGVIDSDYRGEVAMMFDNISQESLSRPVELRNVHNNYLTGIDNVTERTLLRYPHGTYIIRKGDRIAQGVIAEAPQAIFVEVDELGETERGDGGFGSTGVKEDAE
ncbi:dUTP diphosphatase [Aneurinibacillus migulanus]|uniref:dUTP diphosphatase n=1 Tax=Aneurinibacillus migulanus TaxID=47500 RepID=UPI0020A126A4|nr:deoxyuridine 5'-triphosphate nucleotidohydrolase [Aneurinibacillus migulanus]MCP1354634.1 deoxyuridine 5'-triphosphate nucleotidohydrolase [Aneurinibacillus migulanus]